MPKITFIGAGSFGFTRTLVRDLLTFPLLEGSTLCLMDIDATRLDSSRRAVQRIVDAVRLWCDSSRLRCQEGRF